VSRKDELHENLLFELSQIRKELEVLIRLMGRAKRIGNDEIKIRAAASSLQSIYNGIERILQSSLKYADLVVPQGNASHAELLALASKNGIISETTESGLRELMAFRHFYRHSYGFMIDNELLNPLLGKIERLVSQLTSELHLEDSGA
jgi:uncharacterized protein YutE (UPF0331/DUF86 family)